MQSTNNWNDTQTASLISSFRFTQFWLEVLKLLRLETKHLHDKIRSGAASDIVIRNASEIIAFTWFVKFLESSTIEVRYTLLLMVSHYSTDLLVVATRQKTQAIQQQNAGKKKTAVIWVHHSGMHGRTPQRETLTQSFLKNTWVREISWFLSACLFCHLCSISRVSLVSMKSCGLDRWSKFIWSRWHSLQ